MTLLGSLFLSQPNRAAVERAAKWEAALTGGTQPDFVEHRLNQASASLVPWMSTMTPAELLVSRGLGIRPIATISSTCWYRVGYEGLKGHAKGWHIALKRLRMEAKAAGANAVVDVKLRTIGGDLGEGTDFTVVGTAVRINGLPPSPHPVAATVSASEFARLLREGIVPTGVAIGAADRRWSPSKGNPLAEGVAQNRPLRGLSNFWQRLRDEAVAALKSDAERQGNGVLAHTTFSALHHFEGRGKLASFQGCFLILGTTVQFKATDPVQGTIRPVIDMRDDLSPITHPRPHRHTAYPVVNDTEGAI